MIANSWWWCGGDIFILFFNFLNFISFGITISVLQCHCQVKYKKLSLSITHSQTICINLRNIMLVRSSHVLSVVINIFEILNHILFQTSNSYPYLIYYSLMSRLYLSACTYLWAASGMGGSNNLPESMKMWTWIKNRLPNHFVVSWQTHIYFPAPKLVRTRSSVKTYYFSIIASSRAMCTSRTMSK